METVINMSEVTHHFQALSTMVPLHPIHNEMEYDSAVAALNDLLDAGAADEAHPLADLAATLGELIHHYDSQHYLPVEVTGAQTLRFLIDQHGLTQSELPEIGSQGIVSEILRGKRDFNVRQIKARATCFSVNPAVFL